MGDFVIHGKAVVEAGTGATHAVRKDQLDQGIVFSTARENHTGTQTIDTISDAQSYVDGRVQLIVDSAPGALDTLNELAAALGDDANFSATVTTSLNGLDSRLDTLEAAATAETFKATIGNNSASSFTVTHGMGTTDVSVEVFRISTGQTEYPLVTRPSGAPNTVVVDFSSTVPTTNSFRVLVRKF